MIAKNKKGAILGNRNFLFLIILVLGIWFFFGFQTASIFNADDMIYTTSVVADDITYTIKSSQDFGSGANAGGTGEGAWTTYYDNEVTGGGNLMFNLASAESGRGSSAPSVKSVAKSEGLALSRANLESLEIGFDFTSEVEAPPEHCPDVRGPQLIVAMYDEGTNKQKDIYKTKVVSTDLQNLPTFEQRGTLTFTKKPGTDGTYQFNFAGESNPAHPDMNIYNEFTLSTGTNELLFYVGANHRDIEKCSGQPGETTFNTLTRINIIKINGEAPTTGVVDDTTDDTTDTNGDDVSDDEEPTQTSPPSQGKGLFESIADFVQGIFDFLGGLFT